MPRPPPVELPEPLAAPEEVPTPGLTTIAEVAGKLGLPEGALLKAFPVIAEGRGLVLVVVRGDHQINDIKLTNALGTAFRPAREDEFAQRVGPPGSMGPVGADVPVLLDDAVAPGPYVTGANREGCHLRGVEPGRDFPFKRGDVRRVEPGDTVGGHAIRIEPAIEVGNIFKLGTRYSEAFGATYLDESGAEQPIWMGSYGIGPARICAAAVEQFADEQGISWPRSITPFDVHLVGLGARARRSARSPSGSTRSARDRARRHLRRPRPRARREVRRRRAARLPAAPDRRQALHRLRRGRGAGPARAGEPRAPARGRRAGGGGPVADPGLPSSGADRAREQMQDAASARG